MIVASSLMFIQCTSDPIMGPQGEAGINGVNGDDGTNGVDGVDSTTDCRECHSNGHRDPIHASYELSGHAGGGAVGYAGSRASCAQCHSNEGYVEYTERGLTQDWANPTRIDCKTCHSSHETFDFENDGADYALRTVAPVTLMTDANYTIDFEGTSNMCASCHQPRRTPPTSTDGSFAITSSHWGPHHGPQATLLEGIQGAHIIGSVAYPAPQSATHRTGSSCTSCHMGETTDDTDGLHSWVTSDNSCTDCHGANPPSGVAGLEADLATLATLLENVVGWEYVYSILRDTNGDPILNSRGGLQFLDINGDVTTSSSEYVILTEADGVTLMTQEVHAIVHDGHPNAGYYGRGATFTITESEAAWNWILVTEDSSMGTHNPGYVKALVANSIEALQP